jgi:hypothetical protein
MRRHAGCMTSEEQLRARLRKIEALFAGATTPGERGAAGVALARIKARLAEARQTAAAVELQFSLADPLVPATVPCACPALRLEALSLRVSAGRR